MLIFRSTRRGLAAWTALIALIGEPAVAGPQAAGKSSDPAEEEAVLREAEKIERSLVHLVGKVRQSTVSVVRYVEKEVNGQQVEVGGGLGSGVVVSRDGKVFTNVHVVEGASRILVTFSDGETVEAELYSRMPLYDFAMLRVRRAGLVPARFKKTQNVAAGQWALAAGNPRGLGQDGQPIVTLGIISGLGRVAGSRYRYNNAIQTDAEVNPGNSGGPLFDLDGRIIAINGLISTTSSAKTNVGVAYSIPGDQIQSFLPDLLAGGLVESGYSGISIDPVTHEEGGVLVRQVDRGSPADKVGIKAGDRVTGVNQTRIDGYTAWANCMAMLPNGRTIHLRTVRDGRSTVKRLQLRRPPGAGEGR